MTLSFIHEGCSQSQLIVSFPLAEPMEDDSLKQLRKRFDERLKGATRSLYSLK
jgi:hypothetical protein